MKYVCVISVILLCRLASAQLSVDSIDLDRIPQRKIRSYLTMQKEREVNYLSDFRASCFSSIPYTDYTSMKNTYLIKQNPDSVWQVYQNTSVSESWNGKRISCGLLFSKWNEEICYYNQHFNSGVDTGQLFFINLRSMKGMLNLPLGVEVVDVYPIQKRIAFSYLEGNKSQGEQIIQFKKTTDGFTQIVHISNFKSDSKFRDKHLYPFFHTRVINEFHRNMAGHITNDRHVFEVIGKEML